MHLHFRHYFVDQTHPTFSLRHRRSADRSVCFAKFMCFTWCGNLIVLMPPPPPPPRSVFYICNAAANPSILSTMARGLCKPPMQSIAVGSPRNFNAGRIVWAFRHGSLCTHTQLYAPVTQARGSMGMPPSCLWPLPKLRVQQIRPLHPHQAAHRFQQ